jgi:hypothetical protein
MDEDSRQKGRGRLEDIEMTDIAEYDGLKQETQTQGKR